MPTYLSALLYDQLKTQPVATKNAWLVTIFGVFAYRHGYFDPLHLTMITRLANQNGAQAVTVPLTIAPEYTLHDYVLATREIVDSSLLRSHFSLDTNNSAPIAPTALLELDSLDEPCITALNERFLRSQGKLWLAYSLSDAECSLYWLVDSSDPAFAGPLAERFDIWLSAIARRPEQPLLMQPLLTECDRRSLEQGLNGSTIEREFVPVLRQFELHAQSNPSALAVSCLDEHWRYGTLNAKANQLAHHLLDLGVAVGDKVVVYLPTCPAILQCLLAIHKVGAVYVPVDPTLPQVRIAAMCDVVKPRFILGLSDLQPVITEFMTAGTTASFVAVNTSELDALSQLCPPSPALSEDTLSHVFFTSGTTGIPKAVVATQGNLRHYIASAQEHYRFTAQDRFIAAARFTFSISLFELLTPLATGASVELVPREQVLDLATLSAAVCRATVFHFGPSLLKQLLPYLAKHFEPDAFKSIAHASSGGDMVPAEVLRGLREIFTQAEIYVIYGSSEISCMGCTYRIAPTSTSVVSRVGRPFNNVQVRINDAYGNPVPPGVAGLLEFVSPGVVNGYMDLPALTAERFSFAGDGRAYQIGDLGRLDNQGNIELLGRQDFQVQIRGMRVELVEVEQCLKRHPAIADCLVVARTLSGHNEASLVAYIVFALEQSTNARQLSEYLAQHLPDYMMPSLFVVLAKLPTNHNNKIDRSQLPAPCASNMLLSDTFCAPEDDIEQTLLSLLCRVTGMDGIGTQHSFFELGGDSLQAVELLTAINQHYQKFIPITYLLEHATVKALARVVRDEVETPGVGEVVVLKQGDLSKAPLFCLYGVLLYRDLAQSLKTERSVCGVYLEEEVILMQGGTPLTEIENLLTVDAIAERYLQLITQFQQHGPYYLCGHSFGGILVLEVARKLKCLGECVVLVAMIDTMAPRFVPRLPLRQRLKLHLREMTKNKNYGFNKLRNKLLQKRKKAVVQPDIDEIRLNARKIASENYHPAHFDGEVLLLTVLKRPDFEPFILDLGWQQYLANLVSIPVQGDHFSALKDGHVQDLAAQLSPRLADPI